MLVWLESISSHTSFAAPQAFFTWDQRWSIVAAFCCQPMWSSFGCWTKTSLLNQTWCRKARGFKTYPMGLKFGYVIVDTHWNNFYEESIPIGAVEVCVLGLASWLPNRDWNWLHFIYALHACTCFLYNNSSMYQLAPLEFHSWNASPLHSLCWIQSQLQHGWGTWLKGGDKAQSWQLQILLSMVQCWTG